MQGATAPRVPRKGRQDPVVIQPFILPIAPKEGNLWKQPEFSAVFNVDISL